MKKSLAQRQAELKARIVKMKGICSVCKHPLTLGKPCKGGYKIIPTKAK